MAVLNKSNFKAWMQCPLRAWYQVHRKDLIPAPTPVDVYRWNTGQEVGRLARLLFPEGELAVSGHSESCQGAVKTRELMDDQSVKTIFEASFELDLFRLRVDVLKREPEGGWHVIEVKDSTSVKDEHLWDVWYQVHILQRLGVDVIDASLTVLNKEYAYDGGELDLQGLFKQERVREKLADLDSSLSQRIKELESAITNDQALMVAPSKHCKLKGADKECEFFGHCTHDKQRFWIYYLPRISAKKWQEITQLGIEDISEIPDNLKLTDRQEVVRSSTVSGKPFVSTKLADALGRLTYPYHFLDFETANHAIPRYLGTRPYQQIPFQWSCHVLYDDGSTEHHEFLHNSDTDPRQSFADSLLSVLGEQGSIVHYHHFEKQILKALAEALPQLEPRINTIIDRLHDLRKTVSDCYYHPDFCGSYSIKNVLPVLCPDLSYENLNIQDGSMAAIQYMRMIDLETPSQEREAIRKALLEYCELDTLGMVEIWKKLRGLALENR